MIVVTSIGIFGPFARCEQLPGCIRTWPLGYVDGDAGADLPLVVVGAAQILNVETPAGFCADAYTWNGADLVPNAPPVDGAPDAAADE